VARFTLEDLGWNAHSRRIVTRAGSLRG